VVAYSLGSFMDVSASALSPVASLVDSSWSSAKTEVSRCPECQCVRVVSRMQHSELRLIKYGSENGPSDDSDSCCCVCHLDSRDTSRSVSPVSGSLHDVTRCIIEHRFDSNSTMHCCKCRSLCFSYLRKVSEVLNTRLNNKKTNF